MDLTSVAHHLALLTLPAPLDAALETGRCTSPHTLYELNKLHAEQPARVVALLDGEAPITRDAVAQLRDGADSAQDKSNSPRPDRAAQMLARANGLCKRLDTALLRLSKAAPGSVQDEAWRELRERVAAMATRLSN